MKHADKFIFVSIAYRNVRNQKKLVHLVENADKLASSVLSMLLSADMLRLISADMQSIVSIRQ
jgi:hypothetical protein